MKIEHSVKLEDVLSIDQQTKLADAMIEGLASNLRAMGKSDLAGLYFLVSFTWGWARRCKWGTDALLAYAHEAWAQTRRAHNERKTG